MSSISIGPFMAFVIGTALGGIIMYMNTKYEMTDIEYDDELRQFVCATCGGYPVAYSVTIADDDDGEFKRYASSHANFCPECGRMIAYSDMEKMLERALERIEDRQED